MSIDTKKNDFFQTRCAAQLANYSLLYGGSDSRTIWVRLEPKVDPNDSVYSDRLYDWNPSKHDSLCQKHFGNKSQIWSVRDPEDIQKFLSLYFVKSSRVVTRIVDSLTGSFYTETEGG